MIIKEIDIEKYGHNRAVLTKMNEDESIKAELYTVDENGEEVGERDKLVSFSKPYPFELTDEEINELKPINTQEDANRE